jgi:hypothetical protein
MSDATHPKIPYSSEVLMNSRYLTNSALAIAGGFLVVASQAFSASTFEWLTFAIGAVAVLLSGAVALRSRGEAQRVLDGVLGVLGIWTVIAGLEFVGNTITWLGFGSGAAFIALAFAGLTLHELRTERVVHSIDVRGAEAPAGERELALS